MLPVLPRARAAARRRVRTLLILLSATTPVPLLAADPAPVSDPSTPTLDTDNTSAPAAPAEEAAPAQLNEITVIGERFERARNSLSPATGSSEYTFDRSSIQGLAQGDHTPLNEVLLQAPGVAGDSYGQVHVRGDHADLQYRIDGVIIPEGINGFGQVLDTRFADRIDFLTGALPAQYGYRTAGVIDITPRKAFDGGEIDLYGGMHGTLNPAAQFGYTSGGFSAYGTGSYLQGHLGLESPTDDRSPLHDHTTQGKGFLYLSDVLSPQLKLSAIAGSSYNRFEIPTISGVPTNADFEQEACGGPCGFESGQLEDTQFEHNSFGLLALRGLGDGGLTWQVAAFDRVSSTVFEPDPLGELVLNGVAASIRRKSSTAGLQGDLGLPLTSDHTLRAGLFASDENDRADNSSTVFPTQSNPPACPGLWSNQADPGTCVGPAETIVDNHHKNGNKLVGVYVQDQWNLSDSLTLNYGIRYDHIDAFVTASQLSPRLGMIWYATPDTTIHAGYARYLTPPPNELITNATISRFDGTTNAQSGANDPVKPERTHYYDVGVTRQFTPAFNVGLDAYYKNIRQLLDEGQFGNALIFTPFNYADGRAKGVELSVSGHAAALSAYGNLSISKAQGKGIDSAQFNVDPDGLAFTQDHFVHLDHDQLVSGSAGLAYVWRKTTFSLTDLFASGLRTDDPVTGEPNGAHLPFYNRLDAGIEQKLADGFAVRVAGINILDRVYEIRDGDGIGVGTPQFGPRAAAYAGVSKSF